MSANYLATVRGLRELHELAAAGRLDSPEADAIRDATDATWEALTDVEKERIGGLSEDLYSITDPAPSLVDESHPQAQAALDEINHAKHQGEWDRTLEILRRRSLHLPASTLSLLRGETWLEAGDVATASIFLKHASDLQFSNGYDADVGIANAGSASKGVAG